ncbi:formyltransferase family protein [Ascidiimonas sp. W6]|uniref:formyltransferase family protein n=1 Tax=Ascidiimonas meishanensis TaxID=3128903 RepID=UPI0030EC9261
MNLGKKIVFIGARFNVLEQLLKTEDQASLQIFALENSFLSNILDRKQIAYSSFSMSDKKKILTNILEMDFDVLVSNGCPFILPTNKFKTHQTLINVHPTYLPLLQGKTPLNGVFYNNYDFYGATMHYIDEGIDTGAIIHQEKVTLTPDIDLGLLYYLSMKLEGTVFAAGWEVLKANAFAYTGKKQTGTSSYFNRTVEMQHLNFEKDTNKELLRLIKSFGISSQGCTAELEKKEYVIFAAEAIIHSALLEQFKNATPGTIVLVYDGKLLVKTIDGILKITNYKSKS